MEERYVQIFIQHERPSSLVFWEGEWLVVGEATPSTWNFVCSRVTCHMAPVWTRTDYIFKVMGSLKGQDHSRSDDHGNFGQLWIKPQTEVRRANWAVSSHHFEYRFRGISWLRIEISVPLPDGVWVYMCIILAYKWSKFRPNSKWQMAAKLKWLNDDRPTQPWIVWFCKTLLCKCTIGSRWKWVWLAGRAVSSDNSQR